MGSLSLRRIEIPRPALVQPLAGFPSLVSPGQMLQVGRFLATGADGGSLFLSVSPPRSCSADVF